MKRDDYQSIEQHEVKTFEKQPSASSEHLGKERQYWRDIILGINDGLVSTFLLVVGVSGGNFSSRDVLLTALSGALAGAISMFAGEYLATKSQDEVIKREIKLEEKHVKQFHSDEVDELEKLLSLIGIPEHEKNAENKLRASLFEYYGNNDDALLKIMVALEFGVLESEQRKPIWAGITSGLLFLSGAMPSTLPYLFVNDPYRALSIASFCTGIALFAVGFVKTFATKELWYNSAAENLLFTGVGGIFAYYIGAWFDNLISP